MKRLAVAAIIVTTFILLYSCSKVSETISSASINEYSSLQVGKTYLYRLDSTITAAFGASLIVKSYQAKDSIEAAFTDNLGRQSFRIFRYIRDTSAIQPWRFAATYVATPTDQTLEYVDNNMRFVKLHAPIKEGYTWKAHSFIDTKSTNSTVRYLDEWEYEYRDIEQPYTVLRKTYDSTITVFQRDETVPSGPFNPAVFQQKDYGIEVYAKNIGLVYKEFLHWTWNVSSSNAGYEDGSYGVKLQLISHN